jgi:hypothetical protein
MCEMHAFFTILEIVGRYEPRAIAEPRGAVRKAAGQEASGGNPKHR